MELTAHGCTMGLSAYRATVILLFFFLSHFSFTTAIRKDIGFKFTPFCKTTVQGRYLLSDNNGYVCNALSIDSKSRCCPQTGKKFSCHGCNLLSQCCNSYEYCVSCCLNPALTRREQVLKMKIAKPATARSYESIFDYCTGRCRHSSESVVHENAYLSDLHHCFSLPSNSSDDIVLHIHLDTYTSAMLLLWVVVDLGLCRIYFCFWPIYSNFDGIWYFSCMESTGSNSTLTEARLNGINVVVGRQGESCNSVCKSRGQSCVPNKLVVLNHCDIIQKYMNCKGSCLASVGPDQPAEVVYDAPKLLVIICVMI
ncbi:hypothetical protein KIW84_043945 [Lathyrus oleraceus]|uniref:SREBP regulating gene protein n=1 Tax=Pisum sativum TaxID=3888 RepID=A0A9D5APR1_PEA|nr:hypothetical protein KIW84_043945 [Pisum sativum]